MNKFSRHRSNCRSGINLSVGKYRKVTFLLSSLILTVPQSLSKCSQFLKLVHADWVWLAIFREWELNVLPCISEEKLALAIELLQVTEPPSTCFRLQRVTHECESRADVLRFLECSTHRFFRERYQLIGTIVLAFNGHSWSIEFRRRTFNCEYVPFFFNWFEVETDLFHCRINFLTDKVFWSLRLGTFFTFWV